MSFVSGLLRRVLRGSGDSSPKVMDDVGVLERLVTQTWSDETVTGRRSTIAIVLYVAAGLVGAGLALFGDGGGTQVLWGLFAVVFVGLGVTLAVHRSRRE